MIGLGTMINVAGIILGGLLGLVFGKQMKQRFQDTLMSAAALCVLFLGIGGCMEEMLVVTEEGLTTTGSMMMIACFAIGALIGEWLDIDRHMEEFGVWLKKKTKSEGDSTFVDGFVSASLTVCIGAMAVVGSITDGITGDYSILAAKAVLDLIIIMIMTASMGKGCIFSAIPVALLQGTVTLLAKSIEPIMTEAALSNLSFVGNMLIFCVGVNLVFENTRIKVANLLPAIIVAVAWAFLPF